MRCSTFNNQVFPVPANPLKKTFRFDSIALRTLCCWSLKPPEDAAKEDEAAEVDEEVVMGVEEEEEEEVVVVVEEEGARGRPTPYILHPTTYTHTRLIQDL